MMNVLILTGRFGNGHYSAAQTLSAQLKAYGVTSTVVDLIGYVLDKHTERVYKTYGQLINNGCGNVFNLFYKQTEKEHFRGRLPFKHQLIDAVAEIVSQTNADLIITTYSAAAMAVSGYKEIYQHDISFVTCTTDIVAHSNWITANCDLYLAATPFSKEYLIQKGVSPQKIITSGIPVSDIYYHLPKYKTSSARQLLVMGGGCGLLPKQMSFYETLDRLPNTKTTVLLGNNEQLYKRLNGRFAQITPVGYTHNVPDYLAKADVVLSKAGGLSTFEAIAAEKPLLYFPPQLEQEKRNGQYMADNQMAVVLPKSLHQQGQAIADTLKNELHLKRMSYNMRKFKQQLDKYGLQAFISAHCGGQEAL